jgi:hypothetical protein
LPRCTFEETAPVKRARSRTIRTPTRWESCPGWPSVIAIVIKVLKVQGTLYRSNEVHRSSEDIVLNHT